MFQNRMIDKAIRFDHIKKKECYARNIIIEHTPIEMINFFSEAYFTCNFITKDSYERLKNRARCHLLDNDPCSYIYLLCPAETAAANIEKRERQGEKIVSMDVLNLVEKLIHHYSETNIDSHHIVLEYEKDNFHIKELNNFLQECRIREIRRKQSTAAIKEEIKKIRRKRKISVSNTFILYFFSNNPANKFIFHIYIVSQKKINLITNHRNNYNNQH